MVEIDTQFHTKTAKKPYPLAPHNCVLNALSLSPPTYTPFLNLPQFSLQNWKEPVQVVRTIGTHLLRPPPKKQAQRPSFFIL